VVALQQLEAPTATTGGVDRPLGNADEQKEAKPDTVEAWGGQPTIRSAGGTA
jgi:hypothetical protein